MATNIGVVRILREKTGIPVMECKRALDEAGGDIEKAVIVLRHRGVEVSRTRESRVAGCGMVALYSHGFGRLGVMVEMRCETDFTVHSVPFVKLANVIAMHIAWANPMYVSRIDVPATECERERRFAVESLSEAQFRHADKVVEGAMNRFYERVCLLDQFEQKESKGLMTVGQLVDGLCHQTGEKIKVARFVRIEAGVD